MLTVSLMFKKSYRTPFGLAGLLVSWQFLYREFAWEHGAETSQVLKGTTDKHSDSFLDSRGTPLTRGLLCDVCVSCALMHIFVTILNVMLISA